MPVSTEITTVDAATRQNPFLAGKRSPVKIRPNKRKKVKYRVKRNGINGVR